MSILTPGSVLREMDRLAGRLASAPGDFSVIQGEKVGASGYYYVLDENGRIISHPQKALLGFGFRENSLYKAIHERGRGCARQKLGSEDKLVFFVPIKKLGFLCLSVSVSDLTGDDIRCGDLK
ncbi:MAG: hypothetical protein EPN93_01375 [Spirochaetes bacterium]|nr:MAG: hypothetical protein EPN93_01375 [Spirochaetota bacterium]